MQPLLYGKQTFEHLAIFFFSHGAFAIFLNESKLRGPTHRLVPVRGGGGGLARGFFVLELADGTPGPQDT